MKEETPTFYLQDQTTKRTTLDLPPFLNYLAALPNPDFATKHHTNIQEHLHLLAKTYANEEQVMQVVRFLCHTFNATASPVALQLLRTVIGADLKYEASSQAGSGGMEENVKMVDNNQVIALPYAPAGTDAAPYNSVTYGPQLPATIALHAVEPMSDVCDQRKHNDSKNYYAQDNEVVVEYLKEKFILVKREGISTIFGKASEAICLELFEGRLQQFQKLAPAVLLELLKLLEYITPPLYTFYLLHLTQQIVEKVCSIFDQKETEKRTSKSDAEGIVYTLKYIADRWAESQQNSVQNMEWVLQTRVISLFIHSPVSQKKLYAVKLLCEICRRCQYSVSVTSRETIEVFISEKGLLQEIYRADNHPEVISKGEEVFLFLVKEDRLNEDYINAIFNLLEKCHEHLSKSLFATLQRVGHKNIENQRRHLLKRIEQLPRATCFNEETFNLIETIMVSTPSSEAESSLEALYRIMEKNYDKLKEVLKGRAVTVYYEVFIMGIEQGVFDHSNAMITLKPILFNPNSSLFSFMIQNFIFRLKEQYSKQIGLKCKKTLHSAIRMLIVEQQIHKLPVDDQKKHLKILNLLLENYEQLDQNLLSSEDLWVLIKMDRQFSKYIKFYPQDVQVSLISHLISSEVKSPYDIECIIDLYQLMSSEVKAVLAPLLYEDYFKSHHLFSKYLLARHILDIQPIDIDEAVKKLEESRNDLYLALSWIILIRQIINKEDEKGFGKYPPYEDLKNSFELTVKVINNTDVFEPIQSEIKVKNYLSIYELTRLALRGEDVSFQKLKLKLNDQLLTLNQLKQKVCNLTTYRNITLDINETIDCQWFNKDILFDKDNAFKNEIVDILKEVFNKYASRDGKLRPSMVAKIFQKATGTEIIAENDHRVLYIFNNYSNNGDYITIDEWINFYYQSSVKNAPLVIDNLKKLGYSNLLKTEVNFELLFKQDNFLRDQLSGDGKIYQVLFKAYQSLIENSPIHLHDEIVKQFTTTLKLLPVSTHITACLQEMSQYLFDYSTNNTLYYWYLSNLLESVYFRSIEINDHATWKQTFERTSICQQFLTIYEKYLYKVLSNGPNRYQVNIDLQIFIIESLGKVLRKKFTEIPSLVDLKSEFVPCMIRSSFTHIDESILSLIAELGLLSTNICKGKRDQQIVENAVAIVLDMALSNNTNIKISVIESLIFSEILTVRQIFNTFYYLLSSTHPEVKKDYYSIHISRNSKSTYKHCQEYFNILNKLLLTEEDDHYFQEISTVYQKELSQEKYIDNLSESTETDQILLGKLKILNEIKLYNPQTQINVATISSIKQMLENSLSEQVREILYTMTNNICDIEYSLQLMIKIMEQTNLKRNSIHRGKKKMGIMNLGCICYINAVLQQLEMIEPFRKGIIGTEVVVDTIDFFREFQHIIYQLTFGQRIFLIPESFCLNYLDSNNMPINIREQHDADEFLNQLLDRLEFRLKDTNQGHLINNNFKGELVNVINCEKCYHKKEKIQNFYILSVEIKNQNNLKDCLNKLIEPEIICDYFCDFCEGKVETIQKYNRFHSLPPFLFIHLQRLVFDLETFTKIKLDHPVSFPTEINLQDFFERETDPQLYVLKGFVVHVGNSEGGHYYSIIKCDNGWIKFDDTRIEDWDWTKESHDKDHAYLLIYEKKRQGSQIISQEISIGNPHIMKIVQDDINFLMKEKIFLQPSFTRYLLNTMKKIHIPEEFISSPNQHNNPYQYNHLQLPKELQEKLDLGYEAMMHYIKLQTEMREMRINGNSNDMGEDNGVINKEGNQLPSIVYYLICTLHIRPALAFSVAQYFIKEGGGNFLQHIYLHRDKIIREAFKMIAIKLAVVITAVDKDTSFLLPIPHNEVINKLLQKVMVGLTEVGKNPLKMQQYFAMLLDLCKIDHRFVAWFQANKLGPRLIHFYLQKESGLENLLPVYPYYMSSDRRVDSIALMIEVLSLLVHHEPDLSLEPEETLLERKAYLNIELYRKFLNDRYINENITNIFKYAATNQKLSDKIITLVVENLNRFNHDDDYIYIYIHIMYGLLTINDGLSGRRLERLFGVPILTIVGDNDADKYLANSPTDRVCKYWNPCFKPGDEIIFSFLELLYTNRSQHSYFTLLGVVCLLKLMTTSQEVNRYVKQLPGPCRDSKSYVDWIQEFVFNFEKSASSDNNSRMSQQQKHTFLQEIVKYLRELEINQEKSNDQQAKSYLMHLSRTKAQYHIGLVKNYSQWEQVQFEFFENLTIFNHQNIEQIANVTPRDILSIKYRLLYCADAEEMQDCAKVIEYQIDIRQKARLYFTESYDYTFNFESGFYQLALPFAINQLVALRVQLLEEVTVKPRVQEKQSEKMAQEPIIKEEIQDENLMSRREVDDFPSISDVYDQKYQSTHTQNEMRNQRNEGGGGVEIECPFCCFKATSFSSKCPNCMEEWGEMGW